MKKPAPSINQNKTDRFQEKRERIIDAATKLINQHGVKGMTFVGVAEMVGLNTTSVTYYFKRKEQLAAAAFDRTITSIEALVAQVRDEPTTRERVIEFIRANFALRARIRREEERPHARLADMRALDDPFREELFNRFFNLLRSVRHFFGDVHSDEEKAKRTARAHVLLDNMLWLPFWLKSYSIEDFDRVSEQLIGIFDKGIAPRGADWNPELYPVDTHHTDQKQNGIPDQFLRAATELINDRGYRGASVERISSELSVTKGSFYHHLQTKDDLVLECFRRSYHRLSQVQRTAINSNENHWQTLSSAIATLLNIQLFSDFPLLRSTAWQALPDELRGHILVRSDRMAQRFAALLIDGINKREIRAIDPIIASHAIMYMLNAAYELRDLASTLEDKKAVALYASTLAFGILDD
ncbi:MAG: TetR/AcrR family transcriptional regulator [Spongiibacteraceae bacterium]|nr:TetR/AcrR family transcriptional regulator [Spongiibacteraceae bacterium]